MTIDHTSEEENLLYYRLIALWVINEAMLGGIIHGLRLPVSGLVVGSFAVICITLIAWYIPARGAIIKATLVVAIFKMVLSPHSPLPAYFAVFFQGLLGELLFYRRRFFKIACLLLGILSLLESAVQRIVVATVLYGKDVWKALNEFINNLTGQKTAIDYSFFIITVYLLLHLVVGLIVGLWAGMLPQYIQFLNRGGNRYPVISNKGGDMALPMMKRRRRNTQLLFIVWGLLVFLFLQSHFKIGRQLLPEHISVQIFIRSLIIILTWVLIIGPLLKKILYKWLQKKQSQSGKEVEQVLQLLPLTQQLVLKSWQLSAGKKGWGRILLFGRIILANTFYSRDA